MDGSFSESSIRKSTGTTSTVLNDLSKIQINPSETKRLLFEMNKLEAAGYPITGISVVYQSADHLIDSEINILFVDKEI